MRFAPLTPLIIVFIIGFILASALTIHAFLEDVIWWTFIFGGFALVFLVLSVFGLIDLKEPQSKP